ncbi:MAG: plasmid pRiA4b ORF-3 family protein [bacterium]|nr:plasmid pRiA4b ORF-3 family protein [bacterium]
MSSHLSTCAQRPEAASAVSSKRIAEQELFHLQVQGARSSDFWLHLELNGSAKLEDLDDYLRAIWLECCGHLSQFSMGGGRGEEVPQGKRADQVFRSGVELTHIYDFGTPSETLIKVVRVRQGRPLTSHPILLMARNNPLEADCAECGEPASWLCLECLYEASEAGLCTEHAEVHPHQDYGEPVPLVNSPRMGICGYGGPAEAPY